MVQKLDARIDQLRQIKAKRKALKVAFIKSDEPFAEMETLLSGIVFKHLEALGVDSVKTSAGTAYRTEKSSVSLEDPDAFMRHVIGTQQFDLLDRKANVTAVKDFVKDHGHLPPGANLSTIFTLGVRAPTKKRTPNVNPTGNPVEPMLGSGAAPAGDNAGGPDGPDQPDAG